MRSSSSSAQDDGGFIRYPIIDDPANLNPFLADTINIGAVINCIFEGLIRLNFETGEVEPAIAKSWEIGEDANGNQMFTFKIRPGVLFHQIDGVRYAEDRREVTVEDVLWSYKVALNVDKKISIHSDDAVLQSILGASEYIAAMEDMVKAGKEVPLINEEMDVAGLEIVDNCTFRIILSEPNRMFLMKSIIPIVSPEVYMQLGDNISNTPVGTGPYRFLEWRRNNEIVLKANPDYYLEGLSKNAGIRFINCGDPNAALTEYRKGNLDFLFHFPYGERQSVIDEFHEEFREHPGLHIRYWGFNMASGFLADNPLVRRALAHSLDRVTAWEILAEGERFPADKGFLPPSFPASTPTIKYTYDLDLAASLLEEAGYPGGKGLPVIQIYLLESIATEPQVNVWQEGLESLGIQVVFIVEDAEAYWDRIVKDDVMIFQNGWAADFPDPSDVFDYLLYEGSGSMRYDNPQVNKLLDEARGELNKTVRNDLYQQVHDMVMEDTVVIPSGYSKVSWLQKPYVDGFVPSSSGIHNTPMWNVTLNDVK